MEKQQNQLRKSINWRETLNEGKVLLIASQGVLCFASPLSPAQLLHEAPALSAFMNHPKPLNSPKIEEMVVSLAWLLNLVSNWLKYLCTLFKNSRYVELQLAGV